MITYETELKAFLILLCHGHNLGRAVNDLCLD